MCYHVCDYLSHTRFMVRQWCSVHFLGIGEDYSHATQCVWVQQKASLDTGKQHTVERARLVSLLF